MKKIELKTAQGFVQEKSRVLNFISKRFPNNNEFVSFILENDFGILKDNYFVVNGETYTVSHFLSNSKLLGYDIITANKQLGLENSYFTAIALLLGDDIVLMKKTGEIYIWLLENGNGEKIFIASNFNEFIKLLQF